MNIWSHILSKANGKQKLVLIVIIENKGSSPGKKGFKMVVSEDGSLEGSVGGGVKEQEIVEFARDMIQSSEQEIILKNEDNNTLALIPITSGIIKEIELLDKSLSEQKTGILIFSNSGMKFEKDQHQDTKYISNIETADKWKFLELTGNSDKLYIFGAGHVSLALCQACSLIDFEIHLFDNRPGLSTFISNTFANTKQIIDYNSIDSLVTEGKNSYAIIMSHTHEEDEILLGQLSKKDLNYLGMLGSRKKVAKLQANLLAKGHQDNSFDKLHAPIGIDISSQTPMEIAVSIVAELIQVKNC